MSILDDIEDRIDRFDKLYEVICNIIEDKYDCATSEFVQDVRCVYLNKSAVIYKRYGQLSFVE